MQATSLLAALEEQGDAEGEIVMINGAPTDPNAAMFKRGAHACSTPPASRSRSEYDTPDWSPDAAQRQMEQAIAALGRRTASTASTPPMTAPRAARSRP